jgi:hypothetical protein
MTRAGRFSHSFVTSRARVLVLCNSFRFKPVTGAGHVIIISTKKLQVKTEEV